MPVITIAGTNGKGSVAAYCTAILGAAGYRVGTFTSPHLRDYRERIRVHDAKVSSEALLCGVRANRSGLPGAAGGPVSLTFFEYNALAALLIFEAAKLDAWVLEVGMGGRLDAVNVVDPTVAVVVSIGLDHQEFLGSTLEAIAREKAGIFRRGAPAVLGSRELPPVLESTATGGRRAAQAPRATSTTSRAAANRWHYRGTRWDLPDLPPPALVGDTQFDNAATAIAALEELAPPLAVSAAAVAQGLTSVRLSRALSSGRAGAAGQPTWILDVAHNPDAARVLARNLRALPAAGRTLAVCGILADKDAAGVAAQLRDCIDAWWLASTDGARGSSSAELAARIAAQIAAPLNLAGDIAAACAAALAAAGPLDRIVVFGSFHTVGPAMDWLEARGMLPPESLREYTDPPRGF